MTDKNHNKSTGAMGISPVAAAVVGAAIAAGAAVAGAVAMNDKQNRDKVNKAVDTIKNQADQKISQGKSEVKKVIDKVLE